MEMKISDLRITYDDEWLETYVQENGESVLHSPQYRALTGYLRPLINWMNFRQLDWVEYMSSLTDVYVSVKHKGQLEPIKVYGDNRINTGHKRSSSLLALGFDTVLVELVPDSYKL